MPFILSVIATIAFTSVSKYLFTFTDTDQMAMTEYSPSRSGSTEVDRITILSKSETPTPPPLAEADKGAGNIDENRRTGNGSRKSILNSWNEGISLEGANNPNDRLQVAFEGKNCSLPVTFFFQHIYNSDDVWQRN